MKIISFIAAAFLTTAALNTLCQTLSTVRFTATQYAVDGNAGTVTLVVERVGPPDGTAYVEFSTVDGTATAGVDYAATNGYLAFFSGETSVTVEVPILSPGSPGCNHSFSVTLFNPDPFDTTLGDVPNALVTIQTCTVVRFSKLAYGVRENTGFVTLVVERTGRLELTATVGFSTTDWTWSAQPEVDYVSTDGPLEFAPGQSSNTIVVPVIDNALLDGTRRFIVRLFAVESGNAQVQEDISYAVVAICDDEAGGVCIPDYALESDVRSALGKPEGVITSSDMESLTGLTHSFPERLRTLEGLEAASNLTMLVLRGFGRNFDFGGGGPQVGRNTDLSALARLPHLTTLDLSRNGLTNLTLPSGLTNLTSLDLSGNQLIDVSFVRALPNLTTLNLSGEYLPDACFGDFGDCRRFYQNRLTGLSSLKELAHLATLRLNRSRFANLALLSGFTNLTTLELAENPLTDFSVLNGLASLAQLDLRMSGLTNLVLPVGLTNLTSVLLDGNPLTGFVLSESLATTGLADEVSFLRGQGVSIYTYPLAVSLGSAHRTGDGTFDLTLTGPPAIYTILRSTNLSVWSELGPLTNELGRVVFTDEAASPAQQGFYRARRTP